METYDIVIIGTGIAGTSLAYELQKNRLNYLICTDQKKPISNTSMLSLGHCRLTNKYKLDDLVQHCVSKLGEDNDKMRFIYSQADYVPEILNELKIPFMQRSFGIIPTTNRKGGLEILLKMQKHLPRITTDTELIDFDYSDNGFEITLNSSNNIYKTKTRFLVLATGGYGGTFEFTDNIRYKNYNVFSFVKKNGGEIINLNCVFYHPFGYNNGKRVLIGKEVVNGEFIDKSGNPAFNRRTSEKIKNDDYHEIFPELIEQINEHRKKGVNVYFLRDGNMKKIVPTIHYTSGGIKTNYLSMVDGCKNIFAIGECQANGSMNNGRLPGYPFTSAIVYGKVLGNYFKTILS